MTNTPTVPTEQSDSTIELYKGQQSNLTFVISGPGKGKSFSMINLDPEHNFICNVSGKTLPFMSGMKYKDGENMLISSASPDICRALQDASNNPDIYSACIDDAQYIMAFEFMAKASQTGFEKWTIMARNFWNIVMTSVDLRPDFKTFILAHEDTTTPRVRKLKTLGKLLDEKMTPEGMSAITLYPEVEITSGGRNYFFSTQTDGETSAKSPFGMFPLEMPNDLELVRKRIDEYYAGVELKDSELSFEIEEV